MSENKVLKLPKKTKKRGIILIPLILISTTIIILLFSPLFNILHIEVKGISKLTENIIINESHIVYGQNILKLNKNKIKESLNDNPYIKNVTINRKWPDTVMIDVIEKEPMGKIRFFGSDILIDDEAYILEVSTDGSNIDLPLLNNISISSFKLDEKVQTENKETLEKFLKILKVLKNSGMLKSVFKIENNKGILLYLNEGHVANLGEDTNIQYKIMLLKEIIPREKNTAFIDLSNEKKPISKPLWGTLEAQISSEN